MYLLDLPLHAGVGRVGVGSFDGGEAFLDAVIKLVTDTGIVGYGEVSFTDH